MHTGAIKTGCMKTPMFKSRFCALHKPRGITADTSGAQDGSQNEQSTSASTGGNSVVQLAVAKRVTRNATSYKVVHSTNKNVCVRVCVRKGQYSRVWFTLFS